MTFILPLFRGDDAMGFGGLPNTKTFVRFLDLPHSGVALMGPAKRHHVNTYFSEHLQVGPRGTELFTGIVCVDQKHTRSVVHKTMPALRLQA